MPKVSCLIPIYQPSEKKELNHWLDIALKTSFNQTLKDFELLILVDGKLTTLAAKIKSLKDKRIKVFRRNQGLTRNLNWALRNVINGKYVTRIDADDYQHPQRLEYEVNFLEKNPDYGACGCWYFLIDEDGAITKAPCTLPNPESVEELHRLAGIMSGSGTMIRTKALREVGGWGDYKYAQDFSLWVKFRKASWKMHNIKECLYYWRQHKDQISAKYRDEQKRCHQQILKDLCELEQ